MRASRDVSPAARAVVAVAATSLFMVLADRLALPNLAMRMQQVERDDRLQQLAALGCPVVPWRGPGTLDTILHQLARRAQVPKVRAR